MSLASAFRRLCANWPELGAFAGEPAGEGFSSLEPGAVRDRLEELAALAADAEDPHDAELLDAAARFFARLFASGRWRQNPDVLGDLSALLLRHALVAEQGAPEAEQLAGWLTSLPKVLPGARAERDQPDPRALLLARQACRGFRKQVDALADLVPLSALQVALLALAEHQAWLDALRPSTPLGPLGPEQLQGWLTDRGLHLLPAELAEVADAEIARLRAQLDALGPPLDGDDALAFTPDVLREALRTELEVVAGVWRLARLPSWPSRYEVLPPPPGLEGAIPHAAVFTPRPLRPLEPGLVVLNPASSLARDTGRRLLLAVHEGAPGHGLQAARANAAHRPWRAVDLCPIPGLGAGLFAGELMEGWPHFAEARYAELFPDQPVLQRAVAQEALWRAARARADLGFASGELDADAAAQLLIDRAGLSRDDALAEVDDFRLNPTYGLSYFAGKLALRRLRRTAALPEHELYARILGEGLVPLSMSERWLGL